jgi:hypothetical protein
MSAMTGQLDEFPGCGYCYMMSEIEKNFVRLTIELIAPMKHVVTQWDLLWHGSFSSV